MIKLTKKNCSSSPSVYSERSLQRVASMASRAERGEYSALCDGVGSTAEPGGSCLWPLRAANVVSKRNAEYSYGRFAIPFLAAALTFAACDQNHEPIVPDTPDTPTMGYRLTFDGGVGIEQTTRAHWSDERGSGNLIFNWDYTKVGVEPDEMVMGVFDGAEYVASAEGNYSTYAYIKQHGDKPDDAHWAMFETVQTYESEMSSGAYDGHQIIAVSPMLEEYNSSTLTSTAGQFVAEMPMIAAFVQVYDSSPDFLRDYMYMYASGRIEDGNATLAFKHIPATLRFIITYKRPQEAIINTIRVATSDHEAVASKKATITMDASTEEIVPVFSEDCHLDIMTFIAAELTRGETYTAYALALPLADNTAFQGKQLLFSINANDPDNEYLAFTLDAEKLANANPNGEYNWVSGKSYTIRMSLDDVLTVDDISVDDWTDGGTIDGGEAIEWVNGFSTETDEYEPATLNAEGNYEIGNAGNLFWFAEQVNAGNANYNAILTADIDLEDREWTPIGTSTTPYRGIFDGQGHVITGFSQHIEVCGNWGMFGCLNLEAVLK